MTALTRRTFLAGAAGVAGVSMLGLPACSDSSDSSDSSGSGSGLPKASDAPFDTVVVMMMENRSFDHLLGWLPGANGKQAGLSYEDMKGESHDTWPLAPDWQGCKYQDPFHTWQAMAVHYNDGKLDGFLKTQPEGDLFPIGYYVEDDLPILSALAQGYTVYDQYHCSMLGPTWPNRLYQLCATTDLDYTGFYPQPGQPRPVKLETAIFDRAKDAGLTSGYYTFGEPMTGLFASEKYDSITYPIDKFWEDAKDGKLPNVTFVDPDYTAAAELGGTSNDDHAYGSIQLGEAYMAKVHDALTASPQWDRMVAFINFDEDGGFFDHVKPPKVEDDTVLPTSTTTPTTRDASDSDPTDDTVPATGPDLKLMGFRVPCVAISPFAPKRIEQGGPYEHCSILKLIEWRWGLDPMSERDKTANNIAETLDFSKRRDPVTLPAFTPEPAQPCDNKDHLP